MQIDTGKVSCLIVLQRSQNKTKALKYSYLNKNFVIEVFL